MPDRENLRDSKPWPPPSRSQVRSILPRWLWRKRYSYWVASRRVWEFGWRNLRVTSTTRITVQHCHRNTSSRLRLLEADRIPCLHHRFLDHAGIASVGELLVCHEEKRADHEDAENGPGHVCIPLQSCLRWC